MTTPKSTIILFDPATDQIVSRLPAHMFVWREDGALLGKRNHWPITSSKASTPEAIAEAKAHPDKWESIPGIVLLKRGLNPAPDGRILEEEAIFDASPEGIAHRERAIARMEEERRREERTVEIVLSTRGWGDYGVVKWKGDITRPAEEIAKECRRSLDNATDLDRNLTDAEIANEIKKARDAYNAKQAKREASAAHVADCKRRAKETGEKVEIRHYTTECHDPNEECSLDIATEWAMPDGSTRITYQHTW